MITFTSHPSRSFPFSQMYETSTIREDFFLFSNEKLADKTQPVLYFLGAITNRSLMRKEASALIDFSARLNGS